MYGCGKSESPIVAEKPSNNGCDASQFAERVEPRGLAKGNFAEAKQVPDTAPGRE